MTLIKFKKPTENGQANSPVLYNSPFTSLFNNFLGDDFFGNDFAQHMPAINIAEEDNHYHVELSAPGFEKQDFKMEVKDNVLIINGNHESEKEVTNKKFTRKEFNYGSFQRSFTLPETIDTDGIDASYKNGILSITLPKKEESNKTVKEIKIA